VSTATSLSEHLSASINCRQYSTRFSFTRSLVPLAQFLARLSSLAFHTMTWMSCSVSLRNFMSHHGGRLYQGAQTLLSGEISVFTWYCSSDPLQVVLGVASVLSFVVFVVAEVNHNYSQVDRLWPILPTFYAMHFTLWAMLNDRRVPTLYLATLAILVWCVRLTSNYWRKGGYQPGSEDYRWSVLRQYISPPIFTILDFLFISIYQNFLLVSITLPFYHLIEASSEGDIPLDRMDIIFFLLLLGTICVEYIADGQQWG